MAQSDIWVIGNQWAVMGHSGGTDIPLEPLPAHPNDPNDPNNAYKYHGQVAQYAQGGVSDGSGGLLFFFIDGNFYDRDGYMIADVWNATGCNDCVRPGAGQLLPIMVPGTCDMYYLFSSNRSQEGGNANDNVCLYVRILDMSYENRYWLGRQGRVLDDLMAYEERYEDLFGPWWSNQLPLLPFGGEARLVVHQDTKRGAIGSMAASTMSNGNTILGFASAEHFSVLEVTSTGAFLRDHTLNMNGATTFGKSWLRSMDAVTDPSTGEVLVALTDNALLADQSVPIPPDYPVIVHRISNSGIVLATEGYHLTQPLGLGSISDARGPFGCAFGPSAINLFVSGQEPGVGPVLNMIDLATGTATDLIASLSIPSTGGLIRTHLLRNTLPDGTPAIYFARTDRLSALTGLGAINTLGWVDDVSTSVGLNTIPMMGTLGVAGNPPRPYLLQAQVSNDQQAERINSCDCCTYRESQGAAPVTLISQSATFTPGHALIDADADGKVTFMNDLVVQAGKTVNVNNMDWHFAPHARLIIERGARVSFSNSLLTGLECIGCPATRWRGVRVEGNSADNGQTLIAQGSLWLNNSTIAHADTGAWTGRAIAPATPDDAYFGGIISAVNSTFDDCIVGVRVEQYHRRTPQGVELPNLSRFTKSNFRTTPAWNAQVPPKVGLGLYDVNGIRVNGCFFGNLHYGSFSPAHRGIGIESYDAAFTCDRAAQGLPQSFENLYAGVVGSCPDPSEHYTVDGMDFVNNWLGVVDLGSTAGPRIVNCDFTTLLSNTPLVDPSVGLMLYQSERYTVERNSFLNYLTQGPTVGIWFIGPSAENNVVYDNTFDFLMAGCVVQGRHVGTQPDPSVPNTLPGLQMLCGDHFQNVYGHLLDEGSLIKQDQGYGNGPEFQANNRFLTDPICAGGNGFTAADILVNTTTDYGLRVQYHFFDNAGSPEMRPDCIENELEQPLSPTGEIFYNLENHDWPFVFKKVDHCKSGVLDLEDSQGPVSPTVLSGLYQQKQSEWRGTRSDYQASVNLGVTPDLRAMLEAVPPHSSFYLRDELLDHHPLSDAILAQVIRLEPPLDSWHLTQVMIQNSRLSRAVKQTLETKEALPPYFMALVEQAQTGGISLREVMEMEVSQRISEKTFLQRRLLRAWGEDTTLAGKTDSLKVVFMADSLGHGLRDRYLLHLMQGQFVAAADLLPAMDNDSTTASLAQLGRIRDDVDGRWSVSTAQDRRDLQHLAFDHAWNSGAHAWAILRHIGQLDSLPVPAFPAIQKRSYQYRHKERASIHQPLLMALPNPARDRIAFTYSEGLQLAVLEVHDAQGRLVLRRPLNGQRGLVEESVRGWGEGLYLARLLLDGHILEGTKFTVIR